MNKRIHIKDLLEDLKNIYITVELGFLNKILRNASKSDKPNRNKKFASKLGCPINKNTGNSISIYNWMRGYRTIPLTKFKRVVDLSDSSWEVIEKQILSLKAGINKGEAYIKFPVEVGKEIGAIVGYILGDGSIDRRYNQVFFSNKNITLLKDFSNKMELIFNIKPRIWVQTSGNFLKKSKWLYRVESLDKIKKGVQVGLVYPKICGMVLHSVCGNFANGKKKSITKEIKQCNKEFISSMIRAFFDSEGTAYNSVNSVRVHQDDKYLLEDIRGMMLKLGIKSNRVRYYIKEGKRRYLFDITNKENFLKFHHYIGFLSPKKRLSSS